MEIIRQGQKVWNIRSEQMSFSLQNGENDLFIKPALCCYWMKLHTINGMVKSFYRGNMAYQETWAYQNMFDRLNNLPFYWDVELIIKIIQNMGNYTHTFIVSSLFMSLDNSIHLGKAKVLPFLYCNIHSDPPIYLSTFSHSISFICNYWTSLWILALQWYTTSVVLTFDVS